MRNAFLDSSPFYFYETAKDGVVFDSHINCIEKPFHSSYNNIPGFAAEPGSPEGYEEERRTKHLVRDSLRINGRIKESVMDAEIHIPGGKAGHTISPCHGELYVITLKAM